MRWAYHKTKSCGLINSNNHAQLNTNSNRHTYETSDYRFKTLIELATFHTYEIHAIGSTLAVSGIGSLWKIACDLLFVPDDPVTH